MLRNSAESRTTATSPDCSSSIHLDTLRENARGHALAIAAA